MENGLVSTVHAYAYFPGILDNIVLLLCVVMSGTCILLIADNGYLCVRPAFCHVVCLSATFRQRNGAQTRKECIYEKFTVGKSGYLWVDTLPFDFFERALKRG